ncbi:mitochondrial ribosomal protein L13, isoform CRA_b [Rattus norvegicus]|uniref:Mitochondrial ribosomal protein L13, isoform CRA_b n=1 Tax=Rattus norvegicus TaxID=10116 RepID=A6HRH6_RAT|nr:mitochondrial ribosomal protein L13, isoform CRA_b [Rattus norvegicus]
MHDSDRNLRVRVSLFPAGQIVLVPRLGQSKGKDAVGWGACLASQRRPSNGPLLLECGISWMAKCSPLANLRP